MSQIDSKTYVERQLRSQKGVAQRLRKQNEKLRQEVANLKLRAPMNDVLLVIMRLCRANHDLLCELLDKREEKIVVEKTDTPNSTLPGLKNEPDNRVP